MIDFKRLFHRKQGMDRDKMNPVTDTMRSDWMMTPYLTDEQRRIFFGSGDPIRYGTIYLSLEHIAKAGLPGSLAECGVYRGALSKFIHDALPDRRLYLFDTFEGFDQRDSDTRDDERFRDTSVEYVLQFIGTTENIVIRKGYFPETTNGLENERFIFVMLDFDKYEPTLAALRFFYERTNAGGFVFVHDYNSPESNWASSRAVNEFLADKPEKLVFIPDAWGTALFRKL